MGEVLGVATEVEHIHLELLKRLVVFLNRNVGICNLYVRESNIL